MSSTRNPKSVDEDMGGLARQRIIYWVTEDWYFAAHWRALARAARDAGMDVVICTRVNSVATLVAAEEGYPIVPIQMSRSGLNPLRDIASLFAVWRLYRKTKPTLVHHVAMKPIIYGSLAAALAGVPVVVNTFAGLGYIFLSQSRTAYILRQGVKLMLRLVLRLTRARVIFQNKDDRKALIDMQVVAESDSCVIGGAGVDTQRFAMFPEDAGVLRVMFAGRLLWDKGVREFVEAARLLRTRGVAAEFILVGDTDDQNPSAVQEAEICSWQAEGVVSWWGHRTDMPQVYRQAHIVCLPSYREGLPTALVEGASCGRALVATDVPGCREVVVNEVNGLLVSPGDVAELAAAIERLLMDSAGRQQMGVRGREIAMRLFDVRQVNSQTLDLYRDCLLPPGPWVR